MPDISFENILKHYQENIDLLTDEDKNNFIKQSKDYLISTNNKNFKDI